MRVLLVAASAVVLLGGSALAAAAGANSAVGVIKSINPAKDMFTLKDGASYWATGAVKLSNFKVGEKVDVTYTKSTAKATMGRMEATAVKPAD